jgi:tetratricopeptide (TPR) repeat protein
MRVSLLHGLIFSFLFSVSLQTPFDAAQASKTKGNKYFKGGKYDSAITCYTEAISLCPTEHSAEIATFYQNRAAAYEQLVGFPPSLLPLNSYSIIDRKSMKMS